MTDLDLDEIEARYNDWYGRGYDSEPLTRKRAAELYPYADCGDETRSHYIVRNDLPALVDEVRRLREENAELRRGVGLSLGEPTWGQLREKVVAQAGAIRVAGDLADHYKAQRDATGDFLAASRAEASRVREALQAVRDRARSEIADAKEGEHYHAEVNYGAGLAAEQSRRRAWEAVVRALDAAVFEPNDVTLTDDGYHHAIGATR